MPTIELIDLVVNMKDPLLSKNLYSQHTDFLIVKTLLPFVTQKSFIDIGAEKGVFARFLLQAGFEGILFEPCPKHHTILRELVHHAPARFFPYAIDSTDREADFYINCDEQGKPTDYFHSLWYVADDPRIKHCQKIRVTCRCLQSLLQEGILNKHVGILKIDTEGNDLQVLKGIGDLHPEVLICEFFMPGIYNGWKEGIPYNLITEAEKLGFCHHLAFKRYRLNELVSWNPAVFAEQQWGNLIFLDDEIYLQAFQELQKHVLLSEKRLFHTIKQQELISEEKEQVIQKKEQEIQEVHAIAKERLQIIHHLESHPLRLFLKRYLPNFLVEGVRQACSWFYPKLGQFQQYPPIHLHIPEQNFVPQLSAQQSWPIVSIVTPSRNQAQYLERTIQSVLGQDYPKLEYIVQDGASTDETPQILEKYRSQLIQIESCNDTGQANALNRGFERTTGEIMAWLNSDDILLPGTLAYVAKFFQEHPEVDVAYGHRIVINDADQEIGRWILPPHDDTMLCWADYIPQETLFWRRPIWEKAGGYIDESFHFALDWELLLRFREAGATFRRLPRFLAAFRVHAEQKTSQQLEDLGFQEMARLRKQIHGRDISNQEALAKLRLYMVKHLMYSWLYRWKLLRF